MSSVAHVRVSVVDINDNRPVFYPVLYTVSLSTHSSPGTSVVKVTANDPDSGTNGRVTYRTVPGGGSAYFTLNKDTGISTGTEVYSVKVNIHDDNNMMLGVFTFFSSSVSLHRSYFSFPLASWQSQHTHLNGDISRGRRWSDGARQRQSKH